MATLPRIRRRRLKLSPDPSLVICRPHIPSGGPLRNQHIIQRVMSLSDTEVRKALSEVTQDFADRHRDLRLILEQNFQLVKKALPLDAAVDEARQALIGAYFTMEYAVASTALFNPSIVPHPDQSDLEPGEVRFIMSLRAVGEGHVSSIVFRSGIIKHGGHVLFDPAGNYVETPVCQLDPSFDKPLFEQKLQEMNVDQEVCAHLLSPLSAEFSYSQLQQCINELVQNPRFETERQDDAVTSVSWLANSNYKMDFNAKSLLSERVIFPTSESERGGIEDARFVRFQEDNGEVVYYATYTAYNGHHILPQLIRTPDFSHFNILTLNGQAVQNKGMALFPRKINGKYVMLSRQDGENNRIMFSEELHFWNESHVIQSPTEPWELVQLGNCGSPIETSEGWLVLTHGVGPMREYSISAILLDLDNPQRMIARLTQPLLNPHEQEREGYVPNVVYSCGGILHDDELIIPYAMSDISSGIVSVDVHELIQSMTLC